MPRLQAVMALAVVFAVMMMAASAAAPGTAAWHVSAGYVDALPILSKTALLVSLTRDDGTAELEARHAATGSKLWSSNASEAPLVDGGDSVVYLTTETKIVARNSTTGSLIWEIAAPEAANLANLVVYQQDAAAGSVRALSTYGPLLDVWLSPTGFPNITNVDSYLSNCTGPSYTYVYSAIAQRGGIACEGNNAYLTFDTTTWTVAYTVGWQAGGSAVLLGSTGHVLLVAPGNLTAASFMVANVVDGNPGPTYDPIALPIFKQFPPVFISAWQFQAVPGAAGFLQSYNTADGTPVTIMWSSFAVEQLWVQNELIAGIVATSAANSAMISVHHATGTLTARDTTTGLQLWTASMSAYLSGSSFLKTSADAQQDEFFSYWTVATGANPQSVEVAVLYALPSSGPTAAPTPPAPPPNSCPTPGSVCGTVNGHMFFCPSGCQCYGTTCGEPSGVRF